MHPPHLIDFFEFNEDNGYAVCKKCGQPIKFVFGNGKSYTAACRHLENDRCGKRAGGTPKQTTTAICCYCFQTDFSVHQFYKHIKCCKERIAFQQGGIGRVLRDYPGNEEHYEAEKKRFDKYCEATGGEGDRNSVYIAFHVDGGRIRRVLYAGQTGRDEGRWKEHIEKGRTFDKCGVPAVTFAWVLKKIGKQAANALEAALHTLVLTPSKKKVMNARFDSFLANHTLLGATFEEAVRTQQKAASVYLVEALKNEANWTTMPIDGSKKTEEKKKEQEEKKREKKADNYDELLAAFQQFKEATIAGQPPPPDCSPSRFVIPTPNPSQSPGPGCSQASAIYSDKAFSIQQIIEQLVVATGDENDEPVRKRIRTDGQSTTTADSSAMDEEEEMRDEEGANVFESDSDN